MSRGRAQLPAGVVRGADVVDARRGQRAARQAALPQVPQQDRQLQLDHGYTTHRRGTHKAHCTQRDTSPSIAIATLVAKQLSQYNFRVTYVVDILFFRH